MNYKNFLIASAAIIAPLTPVASLADAKSDAGQRVVSIIVEALQTDENSFNLYKSLIQDYGADVMTFAEIKIAVEQEFDIVITTTEAESMVRAIDWVNYVKQRVN